MRVRLAQRGVPENDRDARAGQVMATFGSLGVHTDIAGGMEAVRAQGVRLVTLCHGSASVAEGLLNRAGLADSVDMLLSVEDASAWKPHPSSYGYALASCEVAAGDAMLVAVHPWDIDGAARAGLRIGWLNRRGARYPAYFDAAEVEAVDLVELTRRWR